jgi:SMP-30/Gluconolactonase/LRE-like region
MVQNTFATIQRRLLPPYAHRGGVGVFSIVAAGLFLASCEGNGAQSTMPSPIEPMRPGLDGGQAGTPPSSGPSDAGADPDAMPGPGGGESDAGQEPSPDAPDAGGADAGRYQLGATTTQATLPAAVVDFPFPVKRENSTRPTLFVSAENSLFSIAVSEGTGVTPIPFMAGAIKCKGNIGKSLVCVQTNGTEQQFLVASNPVQALHAEPLPASPNDWVVSKSGTIFFTNRCNDAPICSKTNELGAVWRIQQGIVSKVISTVENPNGIALSPDEKTLWVGASAYRNSDQQSLWQFSVAPNGPMNGKKVATLPTPDGLATDAGGFLAAVSGNNVIIFNPDGTENTRRDLKARATNVAFGGEFLFVTAGNKVLSLFTNRDVPVPQVETP